MTTWRSANGDLPPAPWGPLTVPITCSTGPRSRSKHPVTLTPDWSLVTPHDLEAERILVALGGRLSCIPLNDVVVPALQVLVQLSARRRLPPLTRTQHAGWVISSGTCPRCEGRTFRTPGDAARHVRSLDHWTTRVAPHGRALARLYDEVGLAHAQPAEPRRHSSHPLVREPGGLAELEDAGIPAELVEHVHAVIWSDGPPLPTRLYLSVAYLQVDSTWLTQVVARRPDPDVLTWAAWTYSSIDRRRPQSRLQWLGLGLSTSETTELMHSGRTLEDAEEYADRSGRTLRAAARVLAAWVGSGCTPGPGDLAALDESVGGVWQVPSGGAIDVLLHDIGRLGIEATRTQAALVLAAAGNRPSAVRLLCDGVRDAPGARRHFDSTALQ